MHWYAELFHHLGCRVSVRYFACMTKMRMVLHRMKNAESMFSLVLALASEFLMLLIPASSIDHIFVFFRCGISGVEKVNEYVFNSIYRDDYTLLGL